MESDAYLLSPGQLALLASAPLREIVELLSSAPRLSRREIAERLGRSASTLHHQLVRLRTAGLVLEDETRASGKRPEKTYRLVAQRLSSKAAIVSTEGRRALAAAGRRIATSAARQYERRVRDPDTSLAGSSRRTAVLRLALKLDDAGLERLNRMLDELIEAAGAESSGDVPISLTIILS